LTQQKRLAAGMAVPWRCVGQSYSGAVIHLRGSELLQITSRRHPLDLLHCKTNSIP
jgi:hypothetical protein